MPQRALKSKPSTFGRVRAQPPMAFPGERIGLLGGSFNPPHAAHVLISDIAAKRMELARVWWIVTPGNPLKSHDELAQQEDRIALCRALAQNPRIVPTGFERHLPAAFTAVTLAYLRLRHPGTKFVWIMGADNLATFDRWQHWRQIAAMMPIAVVDRPGWRHRALASRAGRALAPYRVPERRAHALPDMPPPAWTFLTGPLSPLSSTEIRARRAAKTAVQPLERKDPTRD
jgi:nicotinate-nucleotide adenylyltransferase